MGLRQRFNQYIRQNKYFKQYNKSLSRFKKFFTRKKMLIKGTLITTSLCGKNQCKEGRSRHRLPETFE